MPIMAKKVLAQKYKNKKEYRKKRKTMHDTLVLQLPSLDDSGEDEDTTPNRTAMVNPNKNPKRSMNTPTSKIIRD